MRIKLVQVIGSLQIGGAEKLVVQLLNGFDPRYIEKHIVYFSRSQFDLIKKLDSDIKRHFLRIRRWGQISLIIRLARLFKRIKPDIVQAHMFHTNLYVVLAAKLANVPIILTTEHGKNLWKKKAHYLIERFIISPLSTKRIAVSRDILQIRVSKKEIPKEKVVLIPPCTEIPEKTIQYKEKEPLKVGAIGRMVSAKDYPTLLKAFSYVLAKKVDVNLVLIGDGPERVKLEVLSRELGIVGNVDFLGLCLNVRELMYDLDLVVFSSVREGVPVAMLEAMALGIPIIATRVGGIPEVIRDGIDGILVDPRSPIDLGDAIIRMSKDKELRKLIGLKGRCRIKALFSVGFICNEYMQLFRELLSKT